MYVFIRLCDHHIPKLEAGIMSAIISLETGTAIAYIWETKT